MNGNVRHNAAYYMCWPKNNNRGRPDKYAGHPKAVYIREDDRDGRGIPVFRGTGFWSRPARDARDLSTVDDREARDRDAERDRLRRVLADLARR
jgi:hypothetical protein